MSELLLRFNPGCYESVRQASCVLAWNEDTWQMIRGLGSTRRVEKALGGVGQRFIPPEPLQRPPHSVLQLVRVGRPMPRKALAPAPHGLSKVAAQVPVHLTIVGNGEMAEYLPKYLTMYQLHNRVTWVGKVSYEQVKTYYRQADVFLFTSLCDTGPSQLIEAMGYLIPVVTLDLHGQVKLVDATTGIRVPVTEPEAVAAGMAQAIEWLYYHEAERQAMGLNAFHFAQQLWECKVGRLVEKYYWPLLGQPAKLRARAPA